MNDLPATHGSSRTAHFRLHGLFAQKFNIYTSRRRGKIEPKSPRSTDETDHEFVPTIILQRGRLSVSRTLETSGVNVIFFF